MTPTKDGVYIKDFGFESSQLSRGLYPVVALSKFSRLEAAPSTTLVLLDLKAERKQVTESVILVLVSLLQQSESSVFEYEAPVLQQTPFTTLNVLHFSSYRPRS